MRDARQREQQLMETEGQNGIFYMLRKQQNDKLAQMQKSFAEQQELNRLAIVDKILKEENEKERKRKLYPEFYKTNAKPMVTFDVPESPRENVPASRPPPDLSREETQLVSSSQGEIDPIEYASSMTSTHHRDEFDDGKLQRELCCESWLFDTAELEFV